MTEEKSNTLNETCQGNSEINIFSGNIFNPVPVRVLTVNSALAEIQSDKYRAEIERAKQVRASGDKVAYREYKTTLPAYSFSGTFQPGRAIENLFQHSGFMVLDIDIKPDENEQFGGDIESLKSLFVGDPHTFSAFLSPSQGVKVVVPVSGVTNDPEHKLVFADIEKYYLENFQVKIDPSGKNVDRLCFVSWDPNLFYNPGATAFFHIPEPEPEIPVIELPPNFDPAPNETIGTSARDERYYAERGIKNAVNIVERSADGQKHTELLKAGRLLGGYIAGGMLSESEAESVLYDAVGRKPNVASMSDALKTIKKGIAYGQDTPILFDDLERDRQEWIRQNRSRPAEKLTDDAVAEIFNILESDPHNILIPQNISVVRQIQDERPADFSRVRGTVKKSDVTLKLFDNALERVKREKIKSEMQERDENDPANLLDTDLKRSDVFVEKYNEKLKYCFGRGMWFFWNGEKWELDKKHVHVELAKNIVRDFPDFQSLSNIENMTELSQSDPAISVLWDDFDTDKSLFNLKNGTLNLETYEIKKHDRHDFCSQVSGVSSTTDAKSELWEKCLETWFAGDYDMIRFLQTAAGYSMLGRNPEQVLFLLHGSGSNGKSVFLNALKHVFGDYAQSTPIETFVEKKETASNDLADISKARLVLASESEASTKLSTARVKKTTSEDPVKCRFLFKEFFEYVPPYVVWLATNHKPIINDVDHGIWRRVKLVPFEIEIPESETDKFLADRLIEEDQGIFNWILEGWKRYKAEGLKYPEKIRKATQEYKDESDKLAEFIDACCVVNVAVRTPQKDLYLAYQTYCSDTGEAYPYGKQKFNAGIKTRGFKKVKVKGLQNWKGISLLSYLNPPSEKCPDCGHDLFWMEHEKDVWKCDNCSPASETKIWCWFDIEEGNVRFSNLKN